MKIKFSILVLLLLYVSNAETVSLDKACGCTTIQIQSDCVQMTKCEWDSTNNKCIAGLKESYYSQLCVSITDQTKCVKQYGCAFVDKKCVAFGNCISYIGTSNAECQKFSQRCNYNPTKKICTDENVCSEYSAEDKQTECQSVLQINGDPLCLYDTTNKICRKKVCSDYLKTTDDDCKNVLQDITCKTDKVKCVSTYQSCSSYKADDCLSITASDGPCELLPGEIPKCQPRTCGGATDEYKTAEKCNEYKTGCQFNGVNCVSQLNDCKSITADVDTICSKSIGIYGQCSILTGADGKTSCRDPLCTDYVKTTDKECNEANLKLNCITNGYKCVDKLETDCTTVDTDSCSVGKSLKGYCKISQDEKCVDNLCKDNTGSTDTECSKYSATCISNGVNCVESLEETCSKISDQAQCPLVHTKEGKCITSDSTCKLIDCKSQTFTTDEECKPYSGITPLNTCVSNGVQCVNQLTPCNLVETKDFPNCSVIGSDGICMIDPIDTTKCKPTKCEEITDKTLEGCTKGKCKFDGINCVSALQTCDKYTTDCEKVILASGSCVLDTTTNKCVNKICKTAPASNTTDDQCNEYIPGCKTTGQGCIDSLPLCSEYLGTQTICEKYIGIDGKCTGDTKNTETSKCQAKVCLNSTTKNEDGCKAYSPICLFSPLQKSCLQKVPDCSQIKKQGDCEYNVTTADARLCLWQNDKCVTASCNIVNKGGSAEVCAIFGTDCSFDNISGCINKKSYPCSTLRSRQSCTTDSDGKSCLWDVKKSQCFQFDQCEDFPLPGYSGENTQKTPQQIADETAICQQLSDRCFSDGSVTVYNTANCVGKQPCSLLSDSICVKSVGIDGQCGYDGVAKQCVKFDKCSNVVLTTHAECQQYSSTCTSDGTSCVDIKTCADFKLKEGCEIGGTDGLCEWKDETCKLWTCEDSAITTHTGCQAKSADCTSDGTKCIQIASCGSYTETSCQVGLTNKKQVQCIFDKETKICRDKICGDYTNVTSKGDCVSQGCAFDSEKKQCTPIAACKSYTSQSLCDNQGLNSTSCIWAAINDAVTDPTCIEITSCAHLSKNEQLCNARKGCSFISANATANITAACKDTTCSNFNQGSTSITGCKSFLSADQKSITICGWNEKNSTCLPADGSAYDQNNCFSLSQYTYYWSKTANKCMSCSSVTNSSTNSSNSTNGSSDSTTTTDNNAYLLKQFILSSIIFQLV